jgi:hypothetical protein
MLKTTTAVINASQITGVLPVANGGTGVTTSTGTGSTVLSISPTLVTPILGVASATSVNKVAITAPATNATLTIAEGKTLTANNSLTLAGTDATIMTFPTTSATVARIDAANSFTGDQTLATGNLIVSNGKGIDFSATPGTGTSELLADYEEGAFTLTDPGVKDAVSGTWTFVSGIYTKIGRQVTVNAIFSGAGLGFSANTGYYRFDGLPFVCAQSYSGTWQGIEAFKACAGFVFTAGNQLWLHAAITTQTSDSGIVVTATYTV